MTTPEEKILTILKQRSRPSLERQVQAAKGEANHAREAVKDLEAELAVEKQLRLAEIECRKKLEDDLMG